MIGLLVGLCGIGSLISVILVWGELEAQAIKEHRSRSRIAHIQEIRMHEMTVYRGLGFDEYESLAPN